MNPPKPSKTTEPTEPTEVNQPNEPCKPSENSESYAAESTPDDPFVPSESGLLVVNGNVNGATARILIDPGAELNHLSIDFCKNHGIAIKQEDRTAIMANNTEESVDSTKNPIALSIGPYSESMRFAVNKLQYDVILGKKWQHKHRARIDCQSNSVDFCHKGKAYCLIANTQEEQKQITLNAIAKDLKSGSPLFAVLVRKRDEGEPKNDHRPDVKRLLQEYKDVFPEELPEGLPPSRIQGDFQIKLKEGSSPIKKGLYRMSHAELQETKAQVDKLIEQGFVRPSVSPWGSPVLFASKKDGSLRFCVDYRALNRLTVKNSYPLPRIDGLLDQVGEAKFFSTIDLRSGYHQMRIAEEDIPKTAFNTRHGHFEYLVVPFGLSNAPAAFMSMMNKVFHDYNDQFVMVYLDDILVYSNSWDEHMRHLQLVLQRLREHKLYGKLSKCAFGVKEVEYLGFILKAGKLAMNPNKTKAIEVWETPKCKKDVQSFLGLVNYYRRFVRNCSKISKPLTELTKDVPFNWGVSEEKAFRELKVKVTSAPVLSQFDPHRKIFVTTDACKLAIGAVMEQDHQDGCHPVCYAS